MKRLLRGSARKRAATSRVILGRSLLDALALARQLTDWAAEAKAEDIVLLDVRRATYLADYFVICTGTSDRHLAALSERIQEQTGGLGVQPDHVEGTSDSGWLLLDFGDVILHLFSRDLREFYRLDRVWPDATIVLHVL